MPYEALSTAYLTNTSFGNANFTAAQIFYVEALSLILSIHSFRGCHTTHSPLVDFFYIYFEKLSNRNTVKMKLHLQTNKRLCFHDYRLFN
jgi:hypothetical protein